MCGRTERKRKIAAFGEIEYLRKQASNARQERESIVDEELSVTANGRWRTLFVLPWNRKHLRSRKYAKSAVKALDVLLYKEGMTSINIGKIEKRSHLTIKCDECLGLEKGTLEKEALKEAADLINVFRKGELLL